MQALRTGERNKQYRPRIGIAYVLITLDDYSRLAYAEICADEKAVTAVGVLGRAVAWFADHRVTVDRVLAPNGSAFRCSPRMELRSHSSIFGTYSAKHKKQIRARNLGRVVASK